MSLLKKEEINYIDAIQLISLNNLFRFRDNKSTTKEYDYGRIFRYYSKTFHTPLHEVLEIPLHDVLTAYFDDLFENMDPEELEVVRQDLLKTKEERKEDSDKEEKDMFSVMEKVAKEAEILAKQFDEFTKKNKDLPKKPVKPLAPPDLSQFKLKFDAEGNLDSKSLGLLEP